ncbi:MAG: PHP domain-containing protein, partial [Lachnospiraceae bacterium]|nr:PHP domain-containing protein [Lachnospiraceae bacterium]
MSKKFFEVFPTLKLNTGMRDLFEQVNVERVSATKRKDFLRIYISSDRLIQKADVFSVEQEMKKQFFPGAAMVIRIYEKFHLSSQYTLEKLMDIYRESILLELRDYSPIEYNLFKNADITYPSDGKVMLTIEDTVLGKEKAEELVRILDKICNDRCGFSVEILTAYKEHKSVKHKEEDEKRLAMQIAEISARAGAGNTSGIMAAEPADMEVSAGKADRKNDAVKGSVSSADGKTLLRKEPGAGSQGGAFRKGRSADADMRRPVKRSDNPDVLYGKDFEGDALPMEEIIGEIGDVVVRGKILNFDKRDIRNERTILIYDITDFTDTMTVKLFAATEQVDEITAEMKPGAFVKLKGTAVIDKFDHELTVGSIYGVKKIPDFTISRSDTSVRKRVELHCHTKMSDMDGVSEAKDIVKRAYKWGHPAIAITDHGVLQSFPDANHVWEDLWKAEKNKRKEAGEEEPDKQDFFKIIYGVEAYLVDDLREIVTNGRGQDFQGTFVVFDIETTGFSPVNNRIIEIGAVKVSGGQITGRFSAFVNPEVPIPFEIEKLTGIQDDMVIGEPTIDVILPQFLDFCGDAVLVAHNASFDMSFIMENCDVLGIPHDFTYVDTVGI